jgi:DNA-binding transcriptional ArsR family regulator
MATPEALGASMPLPKLTELIHALHNDLARQVLVHLAFGPRDVSGLVAEIERPQGNVSKHLTALRDLGILQRQRTKKNCIYELGPLVSCSVAEGQLITVRIAGRHHTEVTFTTTVPACFLKVSGQGTLSEPKAPLPRKEPQLGTTVVQEGHRPR